MINRIVTRGFGPSRGAAGRAGPTTMGFGGEVSPTLVLEAPYVRRLPHGRSAPNRRLEELIVRARLIELDHQRPPVTIEGTCSGFEPEDRLSVTASQTSIHKEGIMVTARLIKKRYLS